MLKWNSTTYYVTIVEFHFLKDPEPYGSAFINKKKRIDIVEFHVFCFLMVVECDEASGF